MFHVVYDVYFCVSMLCILIMPTYFVSCHMYLLLSIQREQWNKMNIPVTGYKQKLNKKTFATGYKQVSSRIHKVSE